MRKRTFARIGLAIVVAALTMMLAIGVGTAATSDQQLFDMGNQALQQGNLVEAAMYLYAYLQRYPAAAAQNPAHANQVNQAIEESRKLIYDRERSMREEISELRARLTGVGSSVSGLTAPRPGLDPPSPPPQQSYPLACRGAGGMQIDLLAEGFGLTGTMFTMEFRRAVSAGAASLGPGECAWLDRPVGVAEPNRICDLVESSRLHLEFATDGQIRGLASRSAPYLSSLVAGNDVVTFRVFNNGQGCMVATEVPSAVKPRTLPGRGRGGRGGL